MSTAPSGRMVPWYFVIFFSALAAVFAGFAYIAHKTHPGVVTEDAYEKGLKYNIQIARAQAQESLRWHSAFTLSHPSTEHWLLEFTLKDAAEKPVAGAKVSLKMMRPSRQSMDFMVDMAETSPGIYAAEVKPPVPGLWEAQVSAVSGKNSYQAAQRVELKQ